MKWMLDSKQASVFPSCLKEDFKGLTRPRLVVYLKK